MIDLSPRQIQILRAVIEEFIENAEPVGSDTLDKKYNIGVSPATIRNEMVILAKQGYLSKEHTSSGRAPTPMAMKLYVNELMKEKELTVADEVSAKEKIWRQRKEMDAMFHEITRVLAQRSNALGITMIDDDHVYHSGYANLLGMREFNDLEVTRHVLQLIEEINLLEDIFNATSSENQVQIAYGPDFGNKYLEPVGFIHMSFPVHNHFCRIGVLGSSRIDYPYVIPMMKYIRSLIQELVD